MSDATRLTAASPAAWLPRARARDVAGVDKESGAWGHWLFGPSAADLYDADNDRTLTPMDYVLDAGRGWVRIKHRPYFALQSALADATQGTVCAVFKVDAVVGSGLRTELFGTYNSVSPQGASLHLNATPALQFYGYGGGAAYTHLFHSGVDYSGQWLFVGVSRDFDAGTPEVICYLGGAGAEIHEFTGATYATGDNFSLGSDENALSSVGAEPISFAEAIVFESVKTGSELAGIYARSKARLARFGISVV